MNAKRVAAAAGVIFAAQQTRQTAAGIAYALESACLLQSPETAAELAELRARCERYRIAWRRARTRALATGSAADRYAARTRDLQEALRETVAEELTVQMECNALQARVAELEHQLGQAAEQRHLMDPLDHALEALPLAQARPTQVVDDVRPQVTKLRALIARQTAAVEDPHDSPLHHEYRTLRDLPEVTP
ncbi:hypothetical protein J7I98_23880 [Streptomyces sp. ISL-98]|uniref:hypothetical protein n=1 Tax=Streptomyces sp. ISL-98 TaxID=2819192 RepID=UPI001BE613FC|nr:hypothetical protein [Streptomyces sp. ISL-98]MBT2508871.1 hypothetical protein [Streptomyces sp. ISL-98]